jgi:hypothetical protein
VLLEHLEAFSSRDNRRLAAALSLPFVHLWQDGEILQYQCRDDVDILRQYAKSGIDEKTFWRTELDAANLILDWVDLKAFCVRFTRYSVAGGVAGRAEALWVVIRDGDSWKMKLRIGAARVNCN